MTRAPGATYRVQLTPDFPLPALTALLPYLAALGVTHVYLSPIFRARDGSTHGYDVLDPTVISDALGGESAFIALASAARNLRLALILDVVPNHMVVSPENPWLRDVLEAGERSPFARCFDIDWGGGPVVLPLLAAPYADVLATGGFEVVLTEDGLVVDTPCGTLPLAPQTWAQVFSPGSERLAAVLGSGAPELHELRDVLRSAAQLRDAGRQGTLHRAELDETVRSRRALAERLRRLLVASPAVGAFVRERLVASNSPAPEERARLHALLEAQHYRLVWWKAATGRRNYRRFADIDDLIAVAVDDEDVFRVTHELVLRLATDGLIAGLRIDHVDGLADPARYFALLRGHLPADVAERLWIAAEHVIAPGATAPADWNVAATTGYDFLAVVTRLQVIDEHGADRMSRFYRGWVDAPPDDPVAVRVEVMNGLLADEKDCVTDRLTHFAADSISGRDLTRAALEHAVIALTARLEGGRTFVRRGCVPEDDAARIARASVAAREAADPLALQFVRDAITRGDERAMPFVLRWQQLCAAVGGKAIEDTLCYRDHRLLALNELGLLPHTDRAELSIDQFRAFCADRLRLQPDTMNATSTHDSKWSEDARARLAVLSEIPAEFARTVECVSAALGSPDPDFTWRLVQVLLAAWPLDGRELPAFRERVKAHVVKAAREQKRATSWLAPNAAHEAALIAHVERVFDPVKGAAAREQLAPLLDRVAVCGAWNSLAALVLKLTVPGVPDVYQGLESWAFHLVDPDNRRAVDFAALERQLAELDAPDVDVATLVKQWPDGRIKQWVTSRALRLRRRLPELFARGAFVPVAVEGARADHVVAFERRNGGERVLIAVGRWFARLGERATGDAFARTRLVVPAPATGFRDVLTGARYDAGDRLAVEEVFGVMPIAVLESDAAGR